MRLYLISTIPGGYAEREFGGIQFCLNKSKKNFCEIITSSTYSKDTLTINPTDFFIVADYYFNPTFKSEDVSKAVKSLIKRLPAEQTAIYYSDPLFKFNNPKKFENWNYFVFFGLSNYVKTFSEDYKNCRLWDNIDISTKKVLNIPISELAFWSYIKMNGDCTDFNKAPSNSWNNISYIINSKVTSRKKMLDYLGEPLTCQFGNFFNVDDEDVKEFARKNPQNDYVSKKAFGLDYLYLQSGAFTLMLDDDKPIDGAWPMRFYECLAVGIVPIIDRRKFLARSVYRGFEFLSKCYFSKKSDLIETICKGLTDISRKALKIDAETFMQRYVYDFTRLYNLTQEALLSR